MPFPLMLVVFCGAVGEAVEIPLTVVAVCGAVSAAAAMPGASITKQLSVIVRPVSMPPPNCTPDRRCVSIVTLKKSLTCFWRP